VKALLVSITVLLAIVWIGVGLKLMTDSNQRRYREPVLLRFLRWLVR
jgi:hypothetical protein